MKSRHILEEFLMYFVVEGHCLEGNNMTVGNWLVRRSFGGSSNDGTPCGKSKTNHRQNSSIESQSPFRNCIPSSVFPSIIDN